MELSATYAHEFGQARSAFIYAGLPGEPAFGPPAFMHRPATMDEPGGADHPPLARLDPHHVRRDHGGLGAG